MWSEFSCLRDDHMHCLVLPWTEDNVLNEWCSIAAQWFERLHVCPSLALLCNDCGIAAQWFELSDLWRDCTFVVAVALLSSDCGIAAQWFELADLWRDCTFVLAWHYCVMTMGTLFTYLLVSSINLYPSATSFFGWEVTTGLTENNGNLLQGLLLANCLEMGSTSATHQWSK